MKKLVLLFTLSISFQALSFWGTPDAEDLCKEIKDKQKKYSCLNGIKEKDFRPLTERRAQLCEKMLKRRNDNLILNCVLGKFSDKLIQVCETAAHNGNLEEAHRCINTFVGHMDIKNLSHEFCSPSAINKISISQIINCYRDQLPEEPKSTPPAPVDAGQR